MRLPVSMYSLPALLLAMIVSGCSNMEIARHSDLAPVPFPEDAFPGYEETEIETAEDVFALDAEARTYITNRIGKIRDHHERGRALLQELFHQAELNLSYRSNANSTANETFHQRSANCISLSILAYAMAEQVGFDARFQEVDVPDFWERRGQYSLMNRHVNVMITPEQTINTMVLMRRIEFEIDFQPIPGLRHPPTREITKFRALAMFYNNKAVDALLAKDHARAFAYLKAAIETDSTLDMALANLALLYSNEGYTKAAMQVYERVLAVSPENAIAADAYAVLLEDAGRADEAEAIRYRIEQARRDNPWFHYIRGEEAYDAGEWLKAVGFYRRALAMDSRVDTFHFGIARAYLQLGMPDLAEMHLRKAERFAGYDDLKQKYQSKLVALSSLL